MALTTVVFSQRPRLDPPPIEIPESFIVPRLRTRVDFDPSFTISEIEAARNPERLNQSMRARRDIAWQIIDRVWGTAPRSRALDGKGVSPPALPPIPIWMTWYEQEDIAQVYEEVLKRRRRSSGIAAIAEIDAVMRSHRTKDLEASLNSIRLGRTLRQFNFPGALDPGPHGDRSTGTIYYSPAYVRHLLANADRIAACDPNAFPTAAKRARSPLDPRATLEIDDVPAELRPADRKNTYALCMDHEMPPDAVMVKTAWVPLTTATWSIEGRRTVWPVTREPFFIMDAEMASHLYEGPAGRWIARPFGRAAAGEGQLAKGIIVTDEMDRKWMLVGMHIAIKTIRNWMWISLFLEDDWGWRAEPQFRARPLPMGPSYWYGMCVVSDFVEGDPQPWSAYDVGGARSAYDLRHPDLIQQQADTIRAVSRVMRGNQWCSNPYIETNMARGNCIGCHQGSPTSFLPTTLTKQKGFNVSDFSFSFASNRANIQTIRRRYGLDDKITPKTKSK